jgi:hypothetical protein
MGLWRFWPFPSALLINGVYGLVLAFIGGNLWKSERFGASPSPSLSFHDNKKRPTGSCFRQALRYSKALAPMGRRRV